MMCYNFVHIEISILYLYESVIFPWYRGGVVVSAFIIWPEGSGSDSKLGGGIFFSSGKPQEKTTEESKDKLMVSLLWLTDLKLLTFHISTTCKSDEI